MSTTTRPATIDDARAVVLAAAEYAGSGMNGDYAFMRNDLTIALDAIQALASLRNIEDRAQLPGGRESVDLAVIDENGARAVLVCADFVWQDSTEMVSLTGNSPGFHERHADLAQKAKRVRETLA